MSLNNMSDVKQLWVLIIYNTEKINCEVIKNIKHKFYSERVRVCVLWKKSSNGVKKAVKKLCHEANRIGDFILIIASSKIKGYRLFETKGGHLDLYDDILHPLMRFVSSQNNILCIMNGELGDIQETGRRTNTDSQQQENFRSNGKNICIVGSDADSFIEGFIPIFFKCDGYINTSVDKYRNEFPRISTHFTNTNPNMRMDFCSEKKASI